MRNGDDKNNLPHRTELRNTVVLRRLVDFFGIGQPMLLFNSNRERF